MVGAVYVFKLVSGTWTEMQTLDAGVNTMSNDNFGHAVPLVALIIILMIDRLPCLVIMR